MYAIRFGSRCANNFEHEYSLLEAKFVFAPGSRIQRHLVCDYDVVLKPYHETTLKKARSSYMSAILLGAYKDGQRFDRGFEAARC